MPKSFDSIDPKLPVADFGWKMLVTGADARMVTTSVNALVKKHAATIYSDYASHEPFGPTIVNLFPDDQPPRMRDIDYLLADHGHAINTLAVWGIAAVNRSGNLGKFDTGKIKGLGEVLAGALVIASEAHLLPLLEAYAMPVTASEIDDFFRQQ